MRSGFLVPIGGDSLAVGILIGIVFIILYAIYYKIKKNSNQVVEDEFNQGKIKIPEALTNDGILSVIKKQEGLFNNKNLDLKKNLLVYHTDGVFSVALGMHKFSQKQKIFIRVNYGDNPIAHKFVIKDSGSNILAEPVLGAESLIFSQKKIRYYEISWDELNLLSKGAGYCFHINNSDVFPDEEESGQIYKAVNFVLSLNQKEPNTFIARNE